jgi:hypothetical protein
MGRFLIGKGLIDEVIAESPKIKPIAYRLQPCACSSALRLKPFQEREIFGIIKIYDKNLEKSNFSVFLFFIFPLRIYLFNIV